MAADVLRAARQRSLRTAINAFLAANPKNKHGVHRYTLEEFGLSRAAEKARFSGYCERFGIAVRNER